MQTGRPSKIADFRAINRANRIQQLTIEIEMLEKELDNAKRDLRLLQKGGYDVKTRKD